MPDELKPCPFCGGKAFITETMGKFYVDAFHKRNCIVKPNTWLESTNNKIKKQIGAWNRRADNG